MTLAWRAATLASTVLSFSSWSYNQFGHDAAVATSTASMGFQHILTGLSHIWKVHPNNTLNNYHCYVGYLWESQLLDGVSHPRCHHTKKCRGHSCRQRNWEPQPPPPSSRLSRCQSKRSHLPTEFMQTRQEGTSFRRQWQIYILMIKGKSEQDPFKRKRCVGSDGVALAAILVTALMTDLMLSGCAPSTSLMLKYSTLLGRGSPASGVCSYIALIPANSWQSCSRGDHTGSCNPNPEQLCGVDVPSDGILCFSDPAWKTGLSQ